MPLSDSISTTLGRQFASFKWARNNTLQIFKVAQKAKILDFTSNTNQHAVLYQFQCLVTTDDTYYRKLTNDTDTRFGVRIEDESTIKKAEIREGNIVQFLQADLARFESLFVDFTDQQFKDSAQDIQRIFNHEYLHQGQLIVLFRQAGIKLPERFTKAFDL
ncbi:MAG: hypothetical protein JWP06_684 [Candidatus Saccharibacteria bacterium]|nr:hypothetical protein [Candidatus Saccharibacteria bacterium]